MKFFPNFFLRELMVWYGALAVLGSLAAIFPWELGEKADPFASAPAGIRPEWYFLAQFYTLKLIPSHVWIFEGELLGLAGFGAAGGWSGSLLPVLGHDQAGRVPAAPAWSREWGFSWSAIWPPSPIWGMSNESACDFLPSVVHRVR